MDEKILREMIKEQKQIIDRARSQLNKLYSMADEIGIQVDKGDSYSNHNPTKDYIEEQRRQIMNRVNTIREQAIAQAQKSLDIIPSNAKMSVPRTPNVGGMSMPGMSIPNISPEMNIEDIKKRFEEAIEMHSGKLPHEEIDKIRKKLSGETEDG